MITGIFGVPRCGKTTYLAKLARDSHFAHKYDHIYSDFPSFYTEPFTFNDLEKYRFPNSLLLIDEITLYADSRDFKSFSRSVKEYVTLHGHENCDIVYFCQDFSRCDKTIRNLTYDLWYCSKLAVPVLSNFTSLQCIYRNISINEYSSELTLGYRFARPLELFFGNSRKIIFRPLYYRYFDSFGLMGLDKRQIYSSDFFNGYKF